MEPAGPCGAEGGFSAQLGVLSAEPRRRGAAGPRGTGGQSLSTHAAPGVVLSPCSLAKVSSSDERRYRRPPKDGPLGLSPSHTLHLLPPPVFQSLLMKTTPLGSCRLQHLSPTESSQNNSPPGCRAFLRLPTGLWGCSHSTDGNTEAPRSGRYLRGRSRVRDGMPSDTIPQGFCLVDKEMPKIL